MGDERPGQRYGRTTGSAVLTPPTGLPVVANPDNRGSAAAHRTASQAALGACLCGHGEQLVVVSHECGLPDPGG